MKCPYCGHLGDKVVDSRMAEDGTQVRRRRECEKCGSRFTTFEKAHLERILSKPSNLQSLFALIWSAKNSHSMPLFH